MSDRHLLGMWLSALAAALTLMVAVALLIDPYDIWGTGLSQPKHFGEGFGRITKFQQIRRVQPEIVVLGNSTAETGFSAASLAAMTGQKAYNLAFPGATMSEMRAALNFALVHTPVKTVILGVEHHMLTAGQPERARQVERRAATQRGLTVLDMAQLTFTLGAVRDATLTVFNNSRGVAASHDALGNWVNAAPAGPLPTSLAPRPPVTLDDEQFRAFADMCAAARAAGVRLEVVIVPSYAMLRFDVAQTELWHRRLNATAAEHGVRIWDFSAAPLNSERALFIDAVHFKPKAGDVMLSTVLSGG